MDKNNSLGGSSIGVIECVMNQLKQPYEITVFPWVRAQKLVESGEFDAFFVASENEERNKYAKLSNPLFDSSWVWFVLKESTLDPLSDSFSSDASVGGVFGTNMHTWLKKDFEHIVIKKEAEELFQLLSVARLDAVLLTRPMFKDSLIRLGLNEADFRSVVAKKRPLGVYFGDKALNTRPQLLSQFNAFLNTCQK